MSRLTPKITVLKKLFSYSGNQCAFPDCEHPLIHDEDFVAQVCHIEAANEGGERYNKAQTDEERRSFDNLILFCYAHHIKTNNVEKFSVESLKAIKATHEAKFSPATTFSIPKEIETKILNAIETQLSLIYNTVKSVKSDTEEILMTLQRMNSAQFVRVADTNNEIYSEYLSSIIDLKDNGSITSALNLLITFKDKNWNTIDNELKYKVIVNHAGILLNMQKFSEAANCLLELNNLDYQSENKAVNLCTAYALLDDHHSFDRIADTFNLKESINVAFWISYIQRSRTIESFEQIRDIIPTQLLEEPEILINLGAACIRQGLRTQAFEYLDHALKILPSPISERWILQSSIANIILSEVGTIERISLQTFTHEEVTRIKLGNELLSEVIDYIYDKELKSYTASIFFNRGISNKILGEDIVSQMDFQMAWNVSKGFLFFQGLVFHLMDLRQFESVDDLFKIKDNIEFKNDIERLEFDILYSRLLVFKKEYDKGTKILLEHLTSVDDSNKFRLLDIICMSFFMAGKYAEAYPYVNQMIDEFPTDSDGYLNKAIVEKTGGNYEESEKNLFQALRIANEKGNASYKIWYTLGEELLEMKFYKEASLCFERLYVAGSLNNISRKLLKSYFHLGDYEKAIKLSQDISTLGTSDPYINDYLFRVYENQNEQSLATEILDRMFSVLEGDAFDHFYKLGLRFYVTLGEESRTRELLRKFLPTQNFNMHERMIIAGQMLDLGEIELGMNLAYDTRTEFWGNHETHEIYIQTVTTKGNNVQTKEEMFPDNVEVECSVDLYNSAKEKYSVFITDDMRLSGNNIIRSKDPLALNLIGKSLGAEVSLPNVIGHGAVLTIELITDRYTFAFHDSMRLLEMKFSGSTSIKIIRHKEGSIENLKNFLIETLKNANKDAQDLIEFYITNPIPIGMIQQHLNRNYVELWLDLVRDRNVPIFCLNANEIPLTNSLVTERPQIVLDLSSLLTIRFLLIDIDMFSELLAFDLCLASSTMIELRTFYKKICNKNKDSLTIEYKNGSLVKNVSDGKSHQALANDVKKIIDWCVENVKIIQPGMAGLEDRDIRDVIGNHSYDTLVLAKETNGFLMCEDERLKSFALGEYGINSFSFYSFISSLAIKNKINTEIINAITSQLIRYNYVYLPISAELLWSFLEESYLTIQVPFTNALNGLLVLNTQHVSLCFSTFAKKLYLSIPIKESVAIILISVLMKIKKRLDCSQVKENIMAVIQIDFKLLPMEKKLVESLINDHL